MQLDVVNVGDGACTLLRVPGASMVIDCGSWRDTSGDLSASLLESAIGARGATPTTLVVTHFDRDHWLGLRAVASRKRLDPPRRSVQIVYPRLPQAAREVRRQLLAYIVLETSPWGNARSLIQEWEDYAAHVIPLPMHEGRDFYALGEWWNVRWPPLTLDARVSARFNRVAERGRALADEYPPLREALEKVYQYELQEEEHDLDLASVGHQQDWDLDEPTEDDSREVHLPLNTNTSAHDPLPAYPDADDDLERRLSSHRREAQGMNNELSLVIENGDRTILNMGDLEGWGLRAFLRTAALRDTYRLLFAPHHGTQRPGSLASDRFPSSWLTVAQNGSEHSWRLQRDFLMQHTDLLLTTAEHGTISLARQWPPYWDSPF